MEFIESKEHKKMMLSKQLKSPSCGLIVIDNFYHNALETRNFILTQEFSVNGNIYNGFTKKTRAGALILSAIFWTSWQPFPIPWGLALDIATGAAFKPDVKDKRVIKVNDKNYRFLLYEN